MRTGLLLGVWFATAPVKADEELELLRFTPLEMTIEAHARAIGRLESTGEFRVDADGATLAGQALSSQLRVSLVVDTERRLVPFLFRAEYEHDVLTGTVYGQPELDGVGLPYGDELEHAIRKASLRASLGWYLHLGGGLTTSQFGLGLVANEGARSAAFLDPRGGDRVLRGYVASGPHTDHKLFAAAAFDKVIDDDLLLDGDEATQVSVALLYGRNSPSNVGVYAVRRQQTTADGRELSAYVADVAGKLTFELGDESTLVLEGELAVVFGDTTFARSPEAPVQDVRQLGAALRATFDAGVGGLVLDALYASGDANLDDGVQSGFRADVNYTLGLLMFQHLYAAQTGRAAFVARSPELQGVPPDGLERFPTRGAITGATVLSPRVFYRPMGGVELYFGHLFAIASAGPLNPYRSRLAGGAVKNSLDGTPGSFLGHELDLGIRSRWAVSGVALTAVAEGGWLFPGDAFVDAAGVRLDPVIGGRFLLAVEI